MEKSHDDVGATDEHTEKCLQMIAADTTKKLVEYFKERWLPEHSGAQIHNSVECLPEKFLKSLQHIVHTEANIQRKMTDPDAFLPYQETIPDEIKASIDDGSLDIHGLCCHPTFGCKYVDNDVVKGQTFDSLHIPSNMLHGFSARHLHAVLSDTDKSGIRGDLANKFHFDTLWHATSPELPGDANGKRRFSLPSAVLAMRSAAMAKRTKSYDAFVHYDHPQNNVSGVESERLSRSGQLYTGTAAIAKAYNAAMCMCFGKPSINNKHYNEFMSTQFSTDEAKAVCGAIARMYHKHPERTQELSNICFNNRNDPTLAQKHENCAKLYRHITSLRSADEVEESLQLQRTRGKEWNDISHNPELVEQAEKLPKEEVDTFKIGNPYNFPWVEPRHANTVNGWENGRKVTGRAYTKSARERQVLHQGGKGSRQFSMSSQSKPFYPKNYTKRD